LIQEFDSGDDRTTTNYDAVKERLAVENDPPPGLLIHSAGFDGNVFRIFDVWESEEHWTRFRDDRLTPIIEQMMAGGNAGAPPTREVTYELHDVVRA
jgi:hypothetical protein